MDMLLWVDKLMENEYGKVLIWLIVILSLMLVDIVTGFIQACVNRKLESGKMSNGLLKKVALLLLLVAIVPLTILLPDYISVSLIISVYVLETANELLSIVENLNKLGIATEIFAPIIRRLNDSRDKGKENEKDAE